MENLVLHRRKRKISALLILNRRGVDFITSYKRFEDESDEELIYRICSSKELIGSWQNVADMLNELLGTEYTESKFRKQYQSFEKLLKANQSKFTDIASQLEEVELKTREFEMEKVKFRDERNAWSKQNYIGGRVIDKLDKLETELLEQGKTNFEIHEVNKHESDNDLLVILSDLHIGQCFSSMFGEYNTDIAKERLENYLSEIISIKDTHNSQNCYVSLQGDTISNSIHKTLAITNRENVIEQIKIASELISSFCYQLTKHFNKIFLSSVVGNHSRIDRKDDALHDERLDSLIEWNVGLSLKHIDNFVLLNRKIDTGIVDIPIREKTYISVHGDYDAFSKSGVANLVLMIGFIPYAILYGHMHTCAIDETSGIKMIRGGSLAGSGDSYTIEKRLSGKPSQMVCVCDKKGVRACYPVEL